jgi:ferredoxin
MKIRVDTDRCIGSGNCVLVEPAVFDQDDEEGVVALRDDAPPAELHEAVRDAAARCPSAAIWIDED